MSTTLQKWPLSFLSLPTKHLEGRLHSYSRTVSVTVWRPVWVPSWGFLAQAVCPTLTSKVYTVYIWGEKKSQTSNPGLVHWRLSQGCVVDRKDSSLPEFTKVNYFCWVRFSNFILETEDRREAGWVCIWDSREERLVFLFSWTVASQE